MAGVSGDSPEAWGPFLHCTQHHGFVTAITRLYLSGGSPAQGHRKTPSVHALLGALSPHCSHSWGAVAPSPTSQHLQGVLSGARAFCPGLHVPVAGVTHPLGVPPPKRDRMGPFTKYSCFSQVWPASEMPPWLGTAGSSGSLVHPNKFGPFRTPLRGVPRLVVPSSPLFFQDLGCLPQWGRPRDASPLGLCGVLVSALVQAPQTGLTVILPDSPQDIPRA